MAASERTLRLVRGLIIGETRPPHRVRSLAETHRPAIALAFSVMVLVATSCSAVELTDPAELVAGDCFDAGSEGGVVPGVEVVLCEESHQYEFFASTSLGAGDHPYPDEEGFRALAREACVPALEKYADVWAADRIYDYGFFFPTQAQWTSGTRRLGCYLYAYGGGMLDASVQVTPSPSRVEHRELSPGSCFDQPPTDLVYTVPVVSCAVAHDYEVVGSFEFGAAAGDPFPAEAEIEQAVVERCLPMLADYAPRAAGDDRLTYSFYRPSEEAWSTGERRVVCFLHAMSGRIEGSARGAYRLLGEA